MPGRRLLTALVLAGASLIALPTAAIAAPPGSSTAPVEAVGHPGAPSAVSGVDDFVFDSMTVDYELGRDESGRSTLHTSEHLVAVFPEFQNRGILRAIPAIYQGHPTHLEILSVTDENGTPRDYETKQDGDFLTLTIAVPKGQYVSGEQHYLIEYTQRDVTHYFEDTDDDEFYWDVNGTGWAQPFGEVAATVTLESELVDAVRETSCYYGPAGSTTQCEVVQNGAVVGASVTDLGPRENMSVVVAFEPGTFAGAPFDPLAYVRMFVPVPALIGVLAVIVNIVFAAVVSFGFRRNARGRGIVVAQYEPPEKVSAFLAAGIVGARSKAMAATIVDLAVRRKLRIVERDASWGRTEFGLQPLGASTDDLLPDERRVLSALFRMPGASVRALVHAFTGDEPPQPEGAGPVRWLTKNDTALGKFVVAHRKSTRKAAVRRGLRWKPAGWPAAVSGLLTAVSFVLLIFTGVTGSGDAAVMMGVFGGMASLWIGLGLTGALAARRPLTREGAELKEHLEGLKEFIRWAEEDRLKMLQSVSGAERIPFDPVPGAKADADPRVVRIYERLLPYAVLFGLEKEWAKELGKYYDESSSPDWYAGSHGFTVGAFSASLGSFSTSVSTSYSGSSSSSSSGGSGGGGSSGGGGGGGGGGGV